MIDYIAMRIVKNILKSVGSYLPLCRTFLPERTFIIEPFVYLDESEGHIVYDKITSRVRWLEKKEFKAHCRDDAERAYWKYAKNTYDFYLAIRIL